MLVIQLKKDDGAKISDIENKYITTADYNKLTNDVVTNKIKSERLVKQNS